MIFRPALGCSLILLGASLASAPCAGAQAEADRFELVHRLNSLDGPDMKPWHMKLTYQRFGGTSDKPTATGQIEAWWAAADRYRIVVTEGGVSSTVLITPDGHFHSEPLVDSNIRALMNYIVHPVSAFGASGTVAHAYPKKIGPASLSCMVLEPEKPLPPALPLRQFQDPPFGLFATYCVNDANGLLMTHPTGLVTFATAKAGTFAGHQLPMSAYLMIGEKKTLQLDLKELKGIDAGAVSLVSTGLAEDGPGIEKVAPNVANSTIVAKVPPEYPAAAKRRGAAGAVVFGARIGTDGIIYQLHLDSAPDYDLAIEAASAISQWRYRPHLRNGEPVDFETTITMNFNVGH